MTKSYIAYARVSPRALDEVLQGIAREAAQVGLAREPKGRVGSQPDYAIIHAQGLNRSFSLKRPCGGTAVAIRWTGLYESQSYTAEPEVLLTLWLGKRAFNAQTGYTAVCSAVRQSAGSVSELIRTSPKPVVAGTTAGYNG